MSEVEPESPDPPPALLPTSIWVAVLNISDRTANKIIRAHRLAPGEVRDAVVCVSGLNFAWNEHETRGLRALVEVRISGDRCLVVLYPTDHPLGDVWNLGSAYSIRG